MTAQITEYIPYHAYRDSGAKWLREVPTHWDVKRLKALFKVVNGATPKTTAPEYWDGKIVWVTPDDLGKLSHFEIRSTKRRITDEGYDSCGARLVPEGSLVLSTRAPIGHLAIAGIPLCTNQGCRSLVFRHLAIPRYFYFQFLAARPAIASLGQGSTFAELASDALNEVQIVEPPLAEQSAIATFLDRETAKIDSLISKKEHLIELLQEKRAALIGRIVTKGLDPEVPTKDSGIEWLGEIPVHWDVKRLEHLTPSNRRIMYGIVLPGPHVEDGIPIVKGGDVSPERLRLDGLSRTSKEIERRYAKSRLHTGDLVYAIRGSIGDVAMVPDELECANLTQDAARVAYGGDSYGLWLLYLLKSRAVLAQMEAGALGATIRGINIRDLKRAVIPVPPRTEQHVIADYLHDESVRTDTLIARVNEAIDRFKELRAALISAAVTGKIDVREEAA